MRDTSQIRGILMENADYQLILETHLTPDRNYKAAKFSDFKLNFKL